MQLVDTEGKPLKSSKSKEEVINILRDLKPKNKEQEKILAMAVGQKVEEGRVNKIRRKIKTGFDGTFKENYKQRTNTDGFTQGRSLRLIASIPREMVYVAKKMWGDDVLTNPEKFKEAFVKDGTGRYCLTVDPKTI